MTSVRIGGNERILTLSIITLTLAIFYWGIHVPLGVATGVAYIAPVLLGLWSDKKETILITAGACSFFIILGYFLAPPGGIHWMTLANRALSLFAVLLTASLILLNKRIEAEKRIMSLFPHENPNPVLRVAPDGRVMYANPASAPLMRAMECQIGGMLKGDCLAKIRQAWITLLPVEFEHRIAGRSYSVQISPAAGGGHMFIYAVDVTERINAEAEARTADRVFHSMKEGVLVTDESGVIRYVNPAFTSITGYPQEEAVGEKSSLLKSGKHGPEFYREMWETIARQGEWSGEVWNRRKNGQIYPQRLTITSIRGQDGLAAQYAGVFYDVTNSKMLEAEAKYQAYHDPLTGLPNRSLFTDRLNQAIARARRNGTLAAVMFMDMDGFKRVNDGYGHATGDMLLRGVAMRLVGCLRESDTVSRFGGDEFTILLEDLKDCGEAAKLAQKIVHCLSEAYLYSGEQLMITPSLGVALFPGDAENETDLLRKADRALYAAKRSGKRCFKLYSMKMDR